MCIYIFTSMHVLLHVKGSAPERLFKVQSRAGGCLSLGEQRVVFTIYAIETKKF